MHNNFENWLQDIWSKTRFAVDRDKSMISEFGWNTNHQIGNWDLGLGTPPWHSGDIGSSKWNSYSHSDPFKVLWLVSGMVLALVNLTLSPLIWGFRAGLGLWNGFVKFNVDRNVYISHFILSENFIFQDVNISFNVDYVFN